MASNAEGSKLCQALIQEVDKKIDQSGNQVEMNMHELFLDMKENGFADTNQNPETRSFIKNKFTLHFSI